jgi:hypothetical protein
MAQGALLNRMTNRIRQSLELPQVLSATTEMRSFLHTDRVKVYRFASDGTGQVIVVSSPLFSSDNDWHFEGRVKSISGGKWALPTKGLISFYSLKEEGGSRKKCIQ